MTSIVDTPTNVPAVNGKMLEVNTGEQWALPFRGSRYSVKGVNKFTDGLCWTRMDVLHPAESIPSGLIDTMVQNKFNAKGIIYITPHKEVITKREEGDGNYTPIYLGKLRGVLKFPGFDLNPSNIQTGNLWRGLHFKHGEEFAVWNRSGNDDHLYWTFKGLYFKTIERYPELCSKVREIRPRCGRIYITEYGHVWMNLPGSEVSPKWHPVFSRLLKEDKQMLAGNDILLRSVHERVMATKTYPIYLGKISEFDSGNPPRTQFSAGAKFGIGGEDAEDSDFYDGKGWRRMRRDL